MRSVGAGAVAGVREEARSCPSETYTPQSVDLVGSAVDKYQFLRKLKSTSPHDKLSDEITHLHGGRWVTYAFPFFRAAYAKLSLLMRRQVARWRRS
jgi:hypothetical protein